MLKHTRSVVDKVFEVWRSPGRFTKNPDLIQLPSGRLMLVYSDTEAHWSQQNQILTLLVSDDLGRTWSKFNEVAEADKSKGDERLVTPRLSRLNDGRLVVLCDHDDDGHFHEDQPSGNWAWWSEDEGKTWDGPHVTGILGIEPDRIIDLPDGTLGVGCQVVRRASQEFAEVLWCSNDGGQTWHERATIAHNGYHRFCEGALVFLNAGKELACVMRENHSAGIPSLVAFSDDCGRTWSDPQMLPFAIHRPYAKQLPDGRVLVTGRNVNGGLGTYAWCGDLHAEAGQYHIGGPRREYAATLDDDALIIENRPDHECRYTLLPPESCRSDVCMEAAVRVEGPDDKPVAFISVSSLGHVLEIAPNWVRLGRLKRAVNMRTARTVALEHRRGVLNALVDGEIMIPTCIWRESPKLNDFYGGDPVKRTQFGQLGEEGKSWWQRVSYSAKNPTLDDFEWTWTACDGLWPDDYQRRRLIQLHGNVPPHPDNGYSSWLMLEDGRIMLVDYTNYGDEPGKSHLVGVYLEPKDYAGRGFAPSADSRA